MPYHCAAPAQSSYRLYELALHLVDNTHRQPESAADALWTRTGGSCIIAVRIRKAGFIGMTSAPKVR